MLGAGKCIGIVLLQWRNLEHACCGRGMYRVRHRCWVHLLGWILDDVHQRNAGSRRRMHGSRQHVGIALLQWRNLDYTGYRRGMYRHGNRWGVHLFRRILGGVQRWWSCIRRGMYRSGNRIRNALL